MLPSVFIISQITAAGFNPARAQDPHFPQYDQPFLIRPKLRPNWKDMSWNYNTFGKSIWDLQQPCMCALDRQPNTGRNTISSFNADREAVLLGEKLLSSLTIKGMPKREICFGVSAKQIKPRASLSHKINHLGLCGLQQQQDPFVFSILVINKDNHFSILISSMSSLGILYTLFFHSAPVAPID